MVGGPITFSIYGSGQPLRRHANIYTTRVQGWVTTAEKPLTHFMFRRLRLSTAAYWCAAIHTYINPLLYIFIYWNWKLASITLGEDKMEIPSLIKRFFFFSFGVWIANVLPKSIWFCSFPKHWGRHSFLAHLPDTYIKLKLKLKNIK